MIDKDLLRQLGWSIELIESVTRVADSMRNIDRAIPEAAGVIERNVTVSAGALYSDSAANNTQQEYRIPQPPPQEEPRAVRGSQSSSTE
jgi:hypothetical protein